MDVVKGTDKKAGVTITSDGVALPYSSLFDYQFLVYFECQGKKNLQFVYEKAGSGLTAISVDGTISNKAYFVLNRNLTSVLPDGKLYLEVKYKIDSTSDFIQSKFVGGATQKYLCDLVESAKNNAML